MIAIPCCVDATHVEFRTVEFLFVRILKRGIEQKLTKVTKEKSGIKERSDGNLHHGQVKTSVPDPATLMAMAIGGGHDHWTARPRVASRGLVARCSQKRSGKSMESSRRYVNHTLLKESEDCDPRISRVGSEAIPRF